MPLPAVNRSSLSPEERRLRSLLHQLLTRSRGLLHGSLIEMARQCGKSSCRCASDEGAKHRSLYLGQTHQGKTTMEYIPKNLEATVRQWVGDFQLATTLLEQINQQARARLKASKQKAVIKSKAAAKKVIRPFRVTTPKPPD